MDLITVDHVPDETIYRSLQLSNEDFAILSMCVEAYADEYRSKHSQIIATYVTRKQLPEAVNAAEQMNVLLAKLDKLQAHLMS